MLRAVQRLFAFLRRGREKLWDAARTEQPRSVMYNVEVCAAAIQVSRAVGAENPEAVAIIKRTAAQNAVRCRNLHRRLYAFFSADGTKNSGFI